MKCYRSIGGIKFLNFPIIEKHDANNISVIKCFYNANKSQQKRL